jgi:hypothetical protein
MSVGYEGENTGAPKAAGGPDSADWDTLKSDASDIADAAIKRGRHFMDAARDQATGYVDRRKNDVAQSVADFATSLRDSTASFDDRPNIRAFVDSAAEGLDQLADSIRQRSFADIYEDIEDVMRRRPAAVAAVTVAVGFLAARFIKASSETAHRIEASRRNVQASARARRGGAA